MATAPPSPSDVKRYLRNFREEVDGVALYEVLAAAEKNDALREVYRRLAITEARHRDLWAERLREAGIDLPEFRPSFRIRVIGWLARRFGTQAVAPIVAHMEAGATTMYDDQPEAHAHNLPADERSHARIFRELGRASRISAGSSAEEIARIEGRHLGADGNALRAAVLGANDGLVSNLSLVMGVAGADPGQSFVVLAGLTGLLAGSLSMALGEWISVQSSREAYERQVSIEADELDFIPEEEQEELALIYQSKGLPPAEARQAAERIIQDREAALDTLTREELGLAPADHQNPWVAAITSFFTFAVGAALPIIPWLFTDGAWGIFLSAVFCGLGLFAVGAAITLFTGRSVWFSGTRMLVFGLVMSAITFGIGALFGAATGI